MTHDQVTAALADGESRQLAEVLRSAHELDESSARLVLEHFRGRTAKGIAWSAGLDDSEVTMLLGHIRARAGEV